MAYDPLYFETPASPALLRELGVPDGVAVHVHRLDRAELVARDPRLEPYQVMFLLTVGPDVDRAEPRTWTPGVDPSLIWLARIRYGSDLVIGEVRPFAAEGLWVTVGWPGLRDGRLITMGLDEVVRAVHGVLLLLELVPSPGPGRPPTDVRHPHEAEELKANLLQAIVSLLDHYTPLSEITPAQLAGLVSLEMRTFQRRRRAYGLDLSAIIEEGYRIHRASRRSIELPTALVQQLNALAAHRRLSPEQLAEELLWRALRDHGSGATPP